jgi:WhiB family redox-sensing transcriptional regulator
VTVTESPWLSDRRGRRPERDPASYAFLPWLGRAACRGKSHLFFGPQGERPEMREQRERGARMLCEGCPVLEPCRRWAREQREYGFWGGESEEDRVGAGYPVAMPIGRVANKVAELRAAARALSGTSWPATRREG